MSQVVALGYGDSFKNTEMSALYTKCPVLTAALCLINFIQPIRKLQYPHTQKPCVFLKKYAFAVVIRANKLINKLICWYSKNICQSKADEPQNNRVAESAYILRAYISPCRNCSICEYDCERIVDLSIPVIEANNIRGPCIPVDLTKFEKEFFDYY